MALVSCSQQDMKRDPQEALALPEFHNPPGRPQFVSQQVEVWGTLAVCHCPIYSGANLPFPAARMRMLFPSASISSGTASLGWDKILLGGQNPSQDAQIPPRWHKFPCIFVCGKICSFCSLQKQPARRKVEQCPWM